MRYVDRELTASERELMQSRAQLLRCDYTRWQSERLKECDAQLDALDLARGLYVRAKTRYTQARDTHRALRLQLRRALGLTGVLTGIEARAEEHLRTRLDASLQHTLALVYEAQAAVAAMASRYCETHNRLYTAIEDARLCAASLDRQAEQMLSLRTRRRRRLYG